MRLTPPFNLRAWIEQNREQLVPPVGNKLLFRDAGFIVMAVGGPNARKDYHHDPGDELFYQFQGAIVLKTIQSGRPVDVTIREGEIFLLPAQVPHSPQRPADSIGLVVERQRAPHELDGFSWYCEHCAHRLHLEYLHVEDIETQLPELFGRFYADLRLCTCDACGTVMQPPAH